MAIVIPEVIIYKSLNFCLEAVRTDWNSKTDKSKTVLSYLFKEDEDGQTLKFNNFNWLDQAKSLLVGDTKENRKLELHFGYNLQRTTNPSLHILLPNDNPSSSAIGMGEGYIDGIVDTVKKEYIPVYNEHYNVNYQIVITSNNYNEVIVTYYFLKAIQIAIKSHLEIKGMQNIVFGGNDIVLGQDIIPVGIYHRNMTISFSYDFAAIDILTREFGTTFNVTGNPVT